MNGDMMSRFRFPLIPYVEQLPYLIVNGMDRWMETGRLMPLCLATLVAYVFLVCRR